MPTEHVGEPSRLLFDDRLKPRRLVVVGILGVTVLWAALIYYAAVHDHVLHLDESGRGLLDHYGFMACFLTGPLVLLNTYWAVAYFLTLMRAIDQFLIRDADKLAAAAIIKPHVDSVLLRGRWKYMLSLFCFVGVAVALADFAQLDRPETYWGNDVFNARRYVLSWTTANAYLLTLWGFIYPLGLFYVFHLAVSAQLIVINLMRRKMLRLNFLHIDKCAGMAKFGSLNLLLMLIYFWMAVAALVLHITHRYTYASLIIGGAAVTALFIVHSIFGIAWVAKAIKTQRNEAVDSLNDRIRSMMEGDKRSFTAAVATMAYRDRVIAVASFPYSGGVSYAVNFLRVAPALTVIAKLMIPGLGRF
jgi:hypothetical protein